MDWARVEKSRSGSPALSYRACDGCRSRKIGCNRKSPCRNCAQQKIPCERKLQTKSRAHSQRVLISPEYKDKIDCIEKRLERIADILTELTAQALVLKTEQSPSPKPHPLLVASSTAKARANTQEPPGQV
ncbi:hypothetical protein QIS74_13028 [Colletotrichum tabaci]|uniref:Zn(2)-C6 fungal-type domain-containing protein n=1 Tax=Colletotrichum tabaci TaxID=1209068 RepID=A0AAV9SVP2_9PEZI